MQVSGVFGPARIVIYGALLLIALSLNGCCGSGTNSTTTTGGGTPNPTNRPVFITTTPDGRFVYVADAGANSIAQFSVSSSGALTPLSPAMVTGLNKPRAIAVSEDSQFVYVGNQGNNTVASFKIGSNGALTPLSQAPVKISGIPSSLVVGQTSPANFLFVGHTGGIARFQRNADGTLTSLGADTAVGPVTDMTEGDGGDGDYYLHVLNTSAQKITDVSINSDGSLNIFTPNFPTGTQPSALVNSGARGTLFALNQGANSISTYDTGDGNINQFVATIPGGNAPVAGFDLALETVDVLLVVNSGNNTLSEFSYVPPSVPTQLQSVGTVPTGANPAWITAVPINARDFAVYVANQSGTVSEYLLDTNTGALTPQSPSSVKA